MMTRCTILTMMLLLAPAAWAQEPAGAPPPGAASLPAGHYKLDLKHASVIAVVRHMHVSDYVIRFDKAEAQFDYDPTRPQATKLDATVDVGSLDVGADYSKNFAVNFLGADKFPKATFAASGMAPNPDGRTGTMTGDLTLNGITHPVTFNVTLLGSGHGLLGGTIAGFKAEGIIRRSEFGSHSWAGVASDEVQLIIRGEFDRK